MRRVSGRRLGGTLAEFMSGIVPAAVVAVPAHARLPFTLHDCLADLRHLPEPYRKGLRAACGAPPSDGTVEGGF